MVGVVLQEGCARLGLVTGRDLAQCVRAGYPRWVSLMVYGAMELAVTGSDVQEVVGSAIALKLLFGLPLWAGCLVTVVDTLTFLLVHRLGMRYLEVLICTLIAVVAACFIASAAQALETSADPATLCTLCSLRPYISPYLPISLHLPVSPRRSRCPPTSARASASSLRGGRCLLQP